MIASATMKARIQTSRPMQSPQYTRSNCCFHRHRRQNRGASDSRPRGKAEPCCLEATNDAHLLGPASASLQTQTQFHSHCREPQSDQMRAVAGEHAIEAVLRAPKAHSVSNATRHTNPTQTLQRTMRQRNKTRRSSPACPWTCLARRGTAATSTRRTTDGPTRTRSMIPPIPMRASKRSKWTRRTNRARTWSAVAVAAADGDDETLSRKMEWAMQSAKSSRMSAERMQTRSRWHAHANRCLSEKRIRRPLAGWRIREGSQTQRGAAATNADEHDLAERYAQTLHSTGETRANRLTMETGIILPF